MGDQNDKDVLKVPTYTDEPGPIKNRSCRDLLFLIVFMLFWGGLLAILYMAVQTGDLSRLKYGSDSDGKLCGVAGKDHNGIDYDHSGMQYLYYFNPLTPTTTYKRCVQACPAATGDVLCQYGITVTSDTNPITITEFVSNGTCVYTLASKGVLYRCAPLVLTAGAEVTITNETTKVDALASELFGKEINSKEIAMTVFQTIVDTWQWILVGSGASLVVAFLWVVLVKYFVAPMVWLTILLVMAVSWGCAGYIWFIWYSIKTGASTAINGYDPAMNLDANNLTGIMVLAIILSAIALLVFLIIFSARSRISLAIEIIEEASKAVQTMPSLILFPILKYILTAMLFAFCILLLSLLSTSGELVASEFNLLTQEYTGENFKTDNVLNGLMLYVVFGWYWTWNLITAIGECTIAGAIAGWYWTRDKKSLPGGLVGGALYRTFRYHLGSLAFGSLIIAIVQTIRFIITQIQLRLKGKESQVAQYILSCLRCCIGCVERFLKFLTKNAYIEIAIYGYGFCKAARKAFGLLLRNAFRVLMINGIANMILFLGKILITLVSGGVGYYIIEKYAETGDFYVAPVMIIMLFAFVVACIFVSVFSMAIDTIFLCFCEDSERNDGSPQRPYYMPDSLRKFTSKNKLDRPNVGDAGDVVAKVAPGDDADNMAMKQSGVGEASPHI